MQALAKSLLGADVGAVCALLGAPEAVAAAGGEVHLAYADDSGRCVADAVVIADGVVVRVVAALRPAGGSRSDPRVGRRIEEVAAVCGEPVRRSKSELGTELLFADCVVTVHDGYVVAVAPAGHRNDVTSTR